MPTKLKKDFSQELHESEKEFISGMTMYSTYFALISGKIYFFI